MLFGGIGAILLGFRYIFHAFGPTEAQVVIWGEVSLCMGVVLLFLAIGLGRSKKRLAKAVLAFGLGTRWDSKWDTILSWMGHHLAPMGHEKGHHSARMGHKGTPTDTILTSVNVMVKRKA